MNVRRIDLPTCHLAVGTVVAIDVIRAFTTAAFAFAAGARDIVVVGTVEDALRLRQSFPCALAMGEVDGLPIDGFDFGNSPASLIGADLGGRRVIQRTSAGTQGIVRSTQATALMAGSFVCAGATARYLRRSGHEDVALLPTGVLADHTDDEDTACADYLEALVTSASPPDSAPFLRRVLESPNGRVFAAPGAPVYVAGDLECCTSVNRFDFALPVVRENGLLIMRPVTV